MVMKDKFRNSKQALMVKFRDATLRFKSKGELDDKLVDAVLYGDLDLARKLMNRGADPNAEHSLALCLAVSKQDTPMLLSLLETGKAGATEQTPLRTAISEGRIVMAYKLIEHGASVDAAHSVALEKGTKYECERFTIFREKYAKAIARVEKYAVAKAEKNASGPRI